MTDLDYDRIADLYAQHVAGELAGKPADRAALDAFAARWAGRGPVADVGCGPGHVTAYLAARGVEVVGIDLSSGMLEVARRLHPGLAFERADLAALGTRPGRFAAITAFYALIHFGDVALASALASLRAVLRPGGEMLAAVHLGDRWLRPGEMWGVPVSLSFRLFAGAEFEAAVEKAGFAVEQASVRDPYPGVEHPTRRLTLRART